MASYYPKEVVDEIRKLVASGVNAAETAKQVKTKFFDLTRDKTEKQIAAVASYYMLKMGMTRRKQRRRKVVKGSNPTTPVMKHITGWITEMETKNKQLTQRVLELEAVVKSIYQSTKSTRQSIERVMKHDGMAQEG
jgi:hypothetical protein